MSIAKRFRFGTALAVAAAAGLHCAHPSASASAPADPGPSTPAIRSAGPQQSGTPRVAAGCLAACQEATYVELSPKGDLCRCWAPNAFQYTFAFPDTAEKLSYSRSRWNSGIQNVRRCQAQGLAWEPSPDRDQIVCLEPSESAAANPRSSAGF